MNLEERIQKFFNFELKLSEQELKYWDIYRHDLFQVVVYDSETQKKNNKNKKTINEVFRIIVNLFIGFIHYSILQINGKKKNLFFLCKRYKIDNLFIDVNANDFINNINNLFIIDTYNKPDYIFALYNKTHKIDTGYLRGEITDDFINKINSYFSNNINRSFFEIRIEKYLQEFNFYSRIFRKLKPKSVFFIQNGIFKGRIKAAKVLNIPTIEIQHGEFGLSHPAYFYPYGFKSSDIIAADYLFVWSEFWKNRIYFPGVNIIPMGNSYYCNNISTERKLYNISVFTNSTHTPILNSFVKKLIDTGFSGNICYKLHPQQVNEFNTIKECWKDYPNVDVILFEKNAIDVIKESNAILLIHSTVAFQAVDMNCKVIFYTVIDEYLAQKDLFNYPNVYLANSLEEFDYAMRQPIKKSTSKIYDDFDKVRFKQFVQKYNL